MEANRKCVICGKDYFYCNRCKKFGNLPSWMNLFDTENCMNIYGICVGYRDGKFDKNTAKEKLQKCNLKLGSIEDGTKAIIDEIMGSKFESNKVEKNVEAKEVADTKKVNTKLPEVKTGKVETN